MKRITTFTWGYWGWGTHAAEFVHNVDAVERARGWRPPLFVDIRIRRMVRAPDFQQSAFEKIVGQRRYKWKKALGNRSIITGRRKIEIADPNEANDLLDCILNAYHEKRRVLFFCSCEHPRTCHRATVAGLLLNAAHRRGIRLTVEEWPGGDPKEDTLCTSPQEVEKVLRGAKRVRLPELSLKEKRKYTELPWYSRLRLSSDEISVAVVSGPAKIGREWFLPILGDKKRKETDTLASLKKTASDLRRSRGYAPRS